MIWEAINAGTKAWKRCLGALSALLNQPATLSPCYPVPKSSQRASPVPGRQEGALGVLGVG